MHLKSLSKLFNKCQRQLYACALAITKNRESAEDAVHDALIAVASKEVKPEDPEAYLYMTVRNKALHHLRKENRYAELDENYLQAEYQDEGLSVLAEQVKQHMALLTMNEQQVVILKLFEDLRFNEISKILDTSENTIASWYRRGLKKLKEALNE